MWYVLEFDSRFYLRKQLHWLNMKECQFQTGKETWIKHPTTRVLLEGSSTLPSKPPDFFYCGMLNIVSRPFRDVFSSFKGEVEYIDVVISGCRWECYVMHIQSLIDAIDVAHSTFESEKYGLKAGISRLRLDETLIGNVDFFVLDCWASPLIVNSDVNRALVEHEFTGIRLLPTDEFREHR